MKRNGSDRGASRARHGRTRGERAQGRLAEGRLETLHRWGPQIASALLSLLGVLLGFALSSGWQAWRDSVADRRSVVSTVVLLKARIFNDVRIASSSTEGLEKHNANVGPFLLPDSRPIQTSSTWLLAPPVVQALDHYEKVILQQKGCYDFAMAMNDVCRRRVAVATCLANVAAVGNGVMSLLNSTYPDVSMPPAPQLGRSFTIDLNKTCSEPTRKKP